jgi:uncharacterized repeat protein (TIGR01451 family)
MNQKVKTYLLTLIVVTGMLVLLGGLWIKRGFANLNENALSYVTQSNNSLSVIDRDLQTVVDNVDLLSKGCFQPWRVRLTPSRGTLYVSCSAPSNLIALNLPDLNLLYSLFYYGGYDDDFMFSPDERYAFISSSNRTDIQVLEIASGTIIQTIPLEGMGHIRNMDISPTGDTIYAAGTGSAKGRVYVIDAETFQVVHMIDFGHEAWDVLAAPDNQRIYISDHFGAGVGIFDVTTFQQIDSIPYTGEAKNLALSNDGLKLFVGEESLGSVDVYNILTHKRLASISVGGIIMSDLTMDCTGKKLYVTSATSVVSVIDTHTYSLNTIQTPADADGIANCPQYQADIVARKLVDNSNPSPGGEVKFSITMGSLVTETFDNVVMTDTLPISLTYKEDSLSATSGTATYQNGVVSWLGSIPVVNPVTVTFAETVPPTATIGTSVINDAVIVAKGKTYVRSAYVDIGLYKSFLPCVSRPCLPIFTDDFSNPSSGWAIANGDGYAMGYDNGAYFIAVNQNWIAWSMLDFGLSDFRIEVDAWPALNLNGATALIFSATNSGFYTFEIIDGNFSVWRYDVSYLRWTPIINWTFSPAIHPGYQVNRMKVVRSGSSILVYANEQLIGSANDGTYRGTWLGMASEAYTGHFDGRFDNLALYDDCLGVKSAEILFKRPLSFDDMWIPAYSGHTWP